MMVRDKDGYWTGDVQCDHNGCKVVLKQEQIHVPISLRDKVKEAPKSLLERGWQCVIGRHYCPDHHKTADELPEGSEKFVENWALRLQGRTPAYSPTSSRDTTLLPTATPKPAERAE